MSSATAWKCLSVNEFISKCNWENIALKASTNSVVQRQKSLVSWQCLITQDFFTLNNWSGQMFVVNPNQQPGISKEITVFDITSTPEQFWQSFNWSGQQNPSLIIDKKHEAIEEAKELINAVEEFTLNDLSQLF